MSNPEQGIGKQLGDSLASVQDAVSEGTTNAVSGISNLRDTVGETVKDYGTNSAEYTKSFLDSNTAIAKFVFLLLLLIVFFILVNLGIYVIGLFYAQSNSIYVIKGLNSGNYPLIITQDPSKTGSVPIPRSDNKPTGMEFTWTTWLNVINKNPSTAKYQHIFSKGGNGTFTTNGIMDVNNAPGLYISPAKNSTDGSVSLSTIMNISTTDTSNGKNYEIITIDNIPLNNWFNLAIRLENKIMDIYINGTLAKRHLFTNVPTQNYDDIYACQNGGFAGNISDVRYFTKALNVFEINNIVYAGPNLSAQTPKKTGYFYLSNLWYGNQT